MHNDPRALLGWQTLTTFSVGLLTAMTQPAHLVWTLFAGLFLATYVWSKRQPAPPSRAEARVLATRSATVFSIVGAACFTWGTLTWPEQLDTPTVMIPALAALIGLMAAVAALATTLMALDTAGLARDA